MDRDGQRLGALAVALCALALPAGAHAFDPELEAKNFAKIQERYQHIVATPEFQLRAQQQELAGPIQLAEILATDPERRPLSLCAQRQGECIGDVRFYDWADSGAGRVSEVLWTSRSGAVISGRVWATAGGPAKRPGVVITTGSVQAPETLYWGLAATLAKNGYVVLTYDVQGQGRSDTRGEAPDEDENVPFQQASGFVDGTEDALDFMLSTPADVYEPRPSCTTGTSHAAKQDRRVDEGFNAAFNPFWELVDSERVGLAGHSLGASAVSFVGQKDARVDAIVAWDNLRAPQDQISECASAPESRTAAPITKPSLGVSNDYGITQTPYTDDPDPQEANGGFLDYQAAGVDSMQANIRGGTHEESAFIPGRVAPVPLGAASLRGQDLLAWYTVAWFDKYVRCPGARSPAACEAEADSRLLSDRWREDVPGQAVDLNDDANVFSFYLRSRFDFTGADGARQVCDDMRTGCDNMAPDGEAVPYSLLADAYGPDPDPDGDGDGSGGEPCALPQRGTSGRDTPKTLPPTAAGDSIRGRRGNDRLRGGKGDDCLFGNAGRDRLQGNQGDDELRGGSGADRIRGGKGRDLLLGGRGNDRIRAADGERDVIRCGRGRDRAIIDAVDRVARSCEIVRVVGSPPE